jgi:hypothetical protein
MLTINNPQSSAVSKLNLQINDCTLLNSGRILFSANRQATVLIHVI